MNLLMISGDRTVSSGKKGAFYYTLEELSKHFERIEVICPSIKYQVSSIKHPSLPNVFFHSSPHGLFYQPFWILKKGKEILKGKKSIHEWVMTVHDYPPFYNGIGARWLWRKTRVPYAVEVHHIVGHPRASSFTEFIGRWMYHFPFCFKATVRHANKVRTVNHEVAEKLSRWGIPKWKIEVVPSLYLDVSALTPDPTIRKEYDVVACARLVANKGLFELLEAISLLKGISCLLIGDGPEKVKLEAHAFSLGVSDRVTFRGWLPEQKDVYREMQKGKIFVMNSRSEGNPRVAVEAMVLGMPVISTRVGIMPEFGKDGEIVRFMDGSAKDLAEKLKLLLADQSAIQAMGERAHAAVLLRFTPGKSVKHYAAFLQNLPIILFITQKIHEQDYFGRLWAAAFRKKGYTVKVLCLEGDPKIMRLEEIGYDQQIFSMGKEKRYGRIRQILTFYTYLLRLRPDRVFVHMSPIWYTFGWKVWFLRSTPVYLWYTHYKMQMGVKLFGLFGKRFFCATSQSLPQYEWNPKKIVTGHGIDLDFWKKRPNITTNPFELLVVHRLSRSKRVEISLRALKVLPEKYTMVIYGIEAEPEYVAELRALVRDLRLETRVTWKGTTPMNTLPEMYASHSLILNMASETIDKTMLEAMTCGCYPVTTKRNAEAIGLTEAPEDSPEAIAAFVQNFKGGDGDALYRIVEEKHSLERLIEKMDRYIAIGE